MAFVILFGCEAIIFGNDAALLHFCMLIKKDGGIRPNEVLATCATQGAKFYLDFIRGKISLGLRFSYQLFR
ncbi:hypothetical protein OC25_06105 [Pedobacter kyungheensis]|uniref:Uncharacterized protein n=1 Tax=Pedobacter kyungheensis TaxID=1069985 RepID=A0A0C1G5L5_9SPHI|nr:hypothetical protein OC25_06105 [Pedobacter kyungheensis]